MLPEISIALRCPLWSRSRISMSSRMSATIFCKRDWLNSTFCEGAAFDAVVGMPFNRQFRGIPLEIDETVTQLSRDRLVDVFHAENILARRYFYPGVHRLEPYRSYFPHAGLLLPETERLAKRVLSLPTGTAVSEEDIRRICEVVRVAVDHGPEVSRRLRKSGAGGERPGSGNVEDHG